ncbi:hypothetical protein Hypma_011134 [Hypsizygus marmoreus]|uniref:Uncharacterized protein n=1 Tax=Hypsizygus marmoreus TaxID=39966 RepID=A0A369JJ71_HYPMA|nr:hypothetical protein Hypma_011134 [Hypsizygus marmoreus]
MSLPSLKGLTPVVIPNRAVKQPPMYTMIDHPQLDTPNKVYVQLLDISEAGMRDALEYEDAGQIPAGDNPERGTKFNASTGARDECLGPRRERSLALPRTNSRKMHVSGGSSRILAVFLESIVTERDKISEASAPNLYSINLRSVDVRKVNNPPLFAFSAKCYILFHDYTVNTALYDYSKPFF